MASDKQPHEYEMSSIVVLARLPFVGMVGRSLTYLLRRQAGCGQVFSGTAAYWQTRYAAGGNSGADFYGKFKARVLNTLFLEQGVTSAVEFGSGDGNQLKLLQIADYPGVGISPMRSPAVARSMPASLDAAS